MKKLFFILLLLAIILIGLFYAKQKFFDPQSKLDNATSEVAQTESATTLNKEQKELIDSLVATIDNNYDMLHTDYTPSVHRLSELGIPAIEAILPLLNNDKEETRLRAQRVFEGVIMRMYGFIPAQGFTIEDGEEKSRIIFNSIGYDYKETNLADRQKAIENLKKWILEN